MNHKTHIYGILHSLLCWVPMSSWTRGVISIIKHSEYGPQFKYIMWMKNTLWWMGAAWYSLEFITPASGLFDRSAVNGDSWTQSLRRAIDHPRWGWLFALQVITFFMNFFVYDGLNVWVPFLGSRSVLPGFLPSSCAGASDLVDRRVWPCKRDRLLSWGGRLMSGWDGWRHLADPEIYDAVILTIACLYWIWVGSLCGERWRCPDKETEKNSDGMEVNEKLEAQRAPRPREQLS